MLQEKAYAKINLGLKVLGKRTDGYHEIDMIMHSVDLCDVLTITHATQLGLQINNSPVLQKDTQENLIIKAARVLQEHTGYNGGAQIILEKNIPLEAGLAGGSSDAAATLRGLNRLWDTKLSLAQLELLAAQIGSDVAFCVRGGTQRSTGRGELVTPLGCTQMFDVVIFKPDFGVSTAWVYNNFKLEHLGQSLDIDVLRRALIGNDYQQAIKAMGNDLESVTIKMHPVLGEIKKRMVALGASYALMSGSGPSVFALVPKRQIGEKILDILGKEYQGIGFVTQSMSQPL